MRRVNIVLLLFTAIFIFALPRLGQAASFTLSPSAGSITIGSTFDVSILLDTQGKSINAVEMSLSFPTDKLQIVSTSAGKSIIGVWTSQPRYDNQNGRINLQGGVPGGINVSGGLITTVTFRTRAVGTAFLKFLPNSKALLNDGYGTDALEQTQNGVYQLILPPPAGPIVASETHPDQSRWYQSQTVVLRWATEENVDGYSYMLSDNPIDLPDNIVDSDKNSLSYKNVSDGIHYFHIKALKNGLWGGITHFSIKIDSAPPALFPIDIIPSARTKERQPVIQFQTTDGLSGIDHYEIKLIPLTPGVGNATSSLLFVETQSPYIPDLLELGDYDAIVRAYDYAGNYQEVTQSLQIVYPLFEFIGQKGLSIRGLFVISWPWLIAIAALIIILLGYLGYRLNRWHRRVDLAHVQKILPSHLKEQLSELKRYRQKYGKALAVFLLALAASSFVLNITRAQSVPRVPAAEQSSARAELGPPLVTTVSRNISNEEIFYVGGKTNAPDATVVIYLQNLQTGETWSQTIVSDKNGDWFYRHPTFLSIGNYLLWAQSKLGESESPPSPQIEMTVRQTAIQFGASRVSYETLYLILTIMLFLIVSMLIAYNVYHGVQGRRKQRLLTSHIKEAEESIRRGFAVLRRDIQAELGLIKSVKLSRALSNEEKDKEERLLRDLDWAEKYIGKEIWEVEKIETV